jgi:hypothetical protein
MLNASQAQKLIDKAVNDEKFRALAKKDGRAALESQGVKVPAGAKINVFENTPTSFHLVLPVQGDLAGVDPNIAKVFEKAWADPKFKAQLLKSPADAIKAATGANLTKKFSITVHEDAANLFNFALPYVPAKEGELSDADLELVAGGKGHHVNKKEEVCIGAGVAGAGTGPLAPIAIGVSIAVSCSK